MSLHCLDRAVLALGLLALSACAAAHAAERELRVCADPDNLPYSKQDGSGFENRIAELVARELGARLSYVWLPQRRGFVRKTLNAGLCDVFVGVPTSFGLVRTTAPYYRSTYAFVYRRTAAPAYRDFDDPRFSTMRIGVQLIGDDLATTPPGHALAMRGHLENVTGYALYGQRPQAERMIEAVAKNEIDVALVWGPQAAYFARRSSPPLAVTPADRPPELDLLPFAFDISMGVRKEDGELQRRLDEVIARRRGELDVILREYSVPRVEVATP